MSRWQVTGTDRSATGSRSVRKTVAAPPRRDSCATWPSTQTSPSRPIQSAILRATVRTGQGASGDDGAVTRRAFHGPSAGSRPAPARGRGPGGPCTDRTDRAAAQPLGAAGSQRAGLDRLLLELLQPVAQHRQVRRAVAGRLLVVDQFLDGGQRVAAQPAAQLGHREAVVAIDRRGARRRGRVRSGSRGAVVGGGGGRGGDGGTALVGGGRGVALGGGDALVGDGRFHGLDVARRREDVDRGRDVGGGLGVEGVGGARCPGGGRSFGGRGFGGRGFGGGGSVRSAGGGLLRGCLLGGCSLLGRGLLGGGLLARGRRRRGRLLEGGRLVDELVDRDLVEDLLGVRRLLNGGHLVVDDQVDVRAAR